MIIIIIFCYLQLLITMVYRVNLNVHQLVTLENLYALEEKTYGLDVQGLMSATPMADHALRWIKCEV